MIRLVLVGAAGRMGRAIESAAQTADGFEIALRVDQGADLPAGWTSDLVSAIQPGMVVVEFSSPAGAVATAALCAGRGVPLVSGATGLAPEQEAAVRAAGAKVAVLRASNFSIGLATLRRALGAALLAAPRSWDVEIVERHHRLKKDSPSGTALALAADVVSARRLADGALRHGREGAVGPRRTDEVGVHAVRGGTWVGDHQVLLAGEGESVELRHVVQDRAAFAHGALAAARFVAAAAPGCWNMDDVLA